MMEKKQSYSTASRKRILQYLEQSRNKAVTVAEIDRYLKQEGNSVNVSTIYRYLDHLAEEGIVQKYADEKGKQAVFQYVQKGQQCDRHLHVQCTCCGKIVHLDCEFMKEFEQHIREQHGFTLQYKKSILYGICKECGKM